MFKRSITLITLAAGALCASACSWDVTERGPGSARVTPSAEALTTGSCAGACGGQSEDGCYCDTQCATYGDCCPDYQGVCTPGGCTSDDECGPGKHCEQVMCITTPCPPLCVDDPTPSGCQGDADCGAGQRCNIPMCIPEGPCPPAQCVDVANDSCATRCGGQAPSGCYCDAACAGYGDCCADRVTFCG